MQRGEEPSFNLGPGTADVSTNVSAMTETTVTNAEFAISANNSDQENWIFVIDVSSANILIFFSSSWQSDWLNLHERPCQ